MTDRDELRQHNGYLAGPPRRIPSVFRGQRRARRSERPGTAPGGLRDPGQDGYNQRICDPLSSGRSERLPSGMALLVVIPVFEEDTEVFRMRGFCCCGEPYEFTDLFVRPDLALADLVISGGMLPVEVLTTMRFWSRTQTALIRWLDERRGHHGDQLELVIWDQTGFDIPWELFWLEGSPGSSRRDGWLGGLVTVTRWFSVTTAWAQVVRDYRDSYLCSGSVAAYIAEDMKQDEALLKALVTESSESIEHLTDLLKRAGDPLSMVYLACHGKFGATIKECLLGELPLLTLDPSVFTRLAPAATFVFLNACHSGRLISADLSVYKSRALRGFSEIFLRSGAAGVLATSGEIAEDRAHEMAGHLLDLLRTKPNLSVAGALRELRSAVAGLTPEDYVVARGNETNRELLPLLYRFMYVYYGSPRTTLALAAAAS